MTRTFCPGPIPDDLRAIHADVLAAFELARDAMRPGTRAASYHALVCDFFESKGYATTRAGPHQADRNRPPAAEKERVERRDSVRAGQRPANIRIPAGTAGPVALGLRGPAGG